MRALILLVLLAPAAAHSDAIARQGADWVRLTLAACQNEKVSAALTAQGKHPDAYRAASAHVDGHDFAACWQPAPGGAAMVYEDGDQGIVPTKDLKPAPEA